MTDLIYHIGDRGYKQIAVFSFSDDLEYNIRKITKIEELGGFKEWNFLSIDKVNKIKAKYELKNKLKKFIEDM